MDRCFLFASLLSPISNTNERTYAASSTAVSSTSAAKSTVKQRGLTASDMAQVRVDWRTFAQVEAGRPFYPLFKDEYPSAYNQYIPTTLPNAPDCCAYSPDVLVIQSDDPATVIVTTPPEHVFDSSNEHPLTRILDLLSALRAKGLASVKHIADLRVGDGNHRLGIVLQKQMAVDGAACGVEELVRGLAYMEDGGEGSECSDVDDEGWSYV